MRQNDFGFLDEADTLEAIAAVEHQRWAHWQGYLHAQCIAHDDGTLVIPAHLATKWKRQIQTDYSELSDKEKASDREQAHEYIAALKHLTAGLTD